MEASIPPQSVSGPYLTAEPNAPSCQLGFLLLLVLVGLLFVRPAEILPSLEGLPIYNVVIVACIVCSLPALVPQLSWSHLRRQPGMLAVVALLPAIIVSHAVRLNFFSAREGAALFGKVLLFFLLICALVTLPHRLESLIRATVVFIVAIAALSLLNYHGLVDVEGIRIAERSMGFDEDGDILSVEQLYGPGIFSDPNDFSLILSTAMLFLVHSAITSPRWIAKLTALMACSIPAYAFAMTRSRGGFLALAAGLAVLAVGRFGWKRSLPLMLLAMPVLLVLFGGRMTSINLSDKSDTAQGRMMIWREGFAELRSSPLFGIGFGNYAERVGHVAHNSFVHAFTELGLFGGVVFFAAFFVPISVLKEKPAENPSVDLTTLDKLRPALLAVLVGYAVGLCSLSRVDVASTYLVLALGTTYCRMLGDESPDRVPTVNLAYYRKLVLAGVGCFIFFNVFVRIL